MKLLDFCSVKSLQVFLRQTLLLFADTKEVSKFDNVCFLLLKLIKSHVYAKLGNVFYERET